MHKNISLDPLIENGMKQVVFITFFFLCLTFDVFCQETNDSFPLTDSVSTMWTDYVLTVKVLDTIENCRCKELRIKNPTIVRRYGEQARFIKIKILEVEKDFSSDGIDTGLIQKIDLLLIPKSLILSKDTVVSILLHRAYSYDYLEFDRIVNRNVIYHHPKYYAGNDGLYISVREKPNWIDELLVKSGLRTYSQVCKGKSKNQKNILRCVRVIKRMKKNSK